MAQAALAGARLRVEALAEDGATGLVLEKELGETLVEGGEETSWDWPKR